VPLPAVAAAVFGVLGIGAERLASVWPASDHSVIVIRKIIGASVNQ